MQSDRDDAEIEQHTVWLFALDSSDERIDGFDHGVRDCCRVDKPTGCRCIRIGSYRPADHQLQCECNHPLPPNKFCSSPVIYAGNLFGMIYTIGGIQNER